MAIITTRKEQTGFEIFKQKKRTTEIFDRRKKLVPNALSIFTPATISEASGAIVTDADGEKLIDFTGGIGVLNAGHCPPTVVKAIQEQAAKFLHTCFGVAAYDLYLDVAERMIELFPHGEATKVMLTNSGAESVENASHVGSVFVFHSSHRERELPTAHDGTSARRMISPFASESLSPFVPRT